MGQLQGPGDGLLIILHNHPELNAISIWSTLPGQANGPLRRSGNRSCNYCLWDFYFLFQGRSYQTACKDVSVCGRTLFCLFPDVNCYDVQYVAFCGCCDWSRNGLLRGDATHWYILHQRRDCWLQWHSTGFSVNKTKASPINTGCGHITKGGARSICRGGGGGVLWICAAVKGIVFM